MSMREPAPGIDPPPQDGDAWIARTRAALDESVEGIDAATLSALNRGRQRALAVARGRPQRWRWPVAAAALAASLAVAVTLVRVPPLAPPPVPTADTLNVRDLELVAGADFELYEDWEFYAWLDGQHADG